MDYSLNNFRIGYKDDLCFARQNMENLCFSADDCCPTLFLFIY